MVAVGSTGTGAPEQGAALFRPPCWPATRTRDLLVVLLTLVTGATDAMGFIRLGGVFTSVMTGNMVLLGVAAGKADESLAVHTSVAFVAYIIGSLAGGRVAGSSQHADGVWPRPITWALCLELVLFAAFAGGFEAVGGAPRGSATYILLGLNAAALGVMSGAVLRFGISGMSTTYLTGTLTTVVARLGSHRSFRGSGRSLATLAALIGGAACGAALVVEVPRAAPAFQLAVLSVVIVMSLTAFPHHREAGEAATRP